jgi:hypothetical protein
VALKHRFSNHEIERSESELNARAMVISWLGLRLKL